MRHARKSDVILGDPSVKFVIEVWNTAHKDRYNVPIEGIRRAKILQLDYAIC